MNKQLQELAKEHLVRDEYTESGWQECHKYEFDSAELEKFAELIVRECMGICDEVQWQYGQYTFTATTVKNRVIEHFGVTE